MELILEKTLELAEGSYHLKRQLLKFLLISFVLIFLAALELYADELRIIDDRGLTRAIKDINAPAEVTAVFSDSFKGTVKLESVDGISSDISAKTESKTEVLFSNVPNGLWRLKVDNGAMPKEVRIK